MNGLVGRRVEILTVKDGEDRPSVDKSGIVVAVERGGTPAMWSVLLQLDSGRFAHCGVDYLRVAKSDEPGDPGPHVMEPGGWNALDALKKLELFLASEFAGLEPGDDEHEVDFAIRLLRELKGELVELGATCEEQEKKLEFAKRQTEAFEARIKELDDEVAELRKKAKGKKPPGPRGPGEENPA